MRWRRSSVALTTSVFVDVVTTGPACSSTAGATSADVLPERGAAIAQICTSSWIAISAAGLAIVPTMTRSALASVTIKGLTLR